MLKVLDATGLDLSDNAPDAVTIVATGPTSSYTVAVSVIEDDSTLPHQYVTGTLDWHDGTPVSVYNGSGTLAISATKALKPGEHVVGLYAHNYAAPDTDRVQINWPVAVVASDSRAEPRNYFFGPILPRDAGSPSAALWQFDSSSDLAILESSVKMLLSTTKGERIMEPEYGTNIRSLVFDPNIRGIEGLIQEEIINALNRWEPRVSIVSVAADRTDREVTVTATFVSKLNRQDFTTTLVYTQ